MWKIDAEFLFIGQINNSRNEIENQDEIISKPWETINSITNNLPLKDPTVALNNNIAGNCSI